MNSINPDIITSDMDAVLNKAIELLKDFSHTNIQPELVLLALILQSNTTAFHLFKVLSDQRGVSLDQLEHTVRNALQTCHDPDGSLNFTTNSNKEVPLSKLCVILLNNALDIAYDEYECCINTAHVLVALFESSMLTSSLLRQEGITLGLVTDVIAHSNDVTFKSGTDPVVDTTKPIIFLSYRRSDSSASAGRIYDRLVQHLPKKNVFKDVDSIPLGADFRVYLSGMLNVSNIIFVIIGPRWLNAIDSQGKQRLQDPNDFVRIEIEEAIKKKITIVPLLIDGAAIPNEDELPDTLKPLVFRNGLAIRNDPDFHNDMNRLLRDLRIMK